MDVEEFERHRTTVTTEYGDMSFVDLGNGPAVLFVHGFALTALFWAQVAEAVGDSHRCLVVDLPGHGRTRVKEDVPLTLGSQADLLAAACRAIGVDHVDVVGNDSGGAISQLLAVRHPELVRSLVLTNCDIHDNCPPAAFLETAQEILAEGVETTLRRFVADLAVARRFIGLGLEDEAIVTPELVRGLYAPLLDDPTGADGLTRWMLSFDGDALVNVESDLRNLDTPTTLVWGTADDFFPLESAYWLLDAIPGAIKVVEVEGGRLFFPLERPHDLVRPLMEHLGRTEIGAGRRT